MNIATLPSTLFYGFQNFWNRKTTQRVISVTLALVFLGGLLLIEMNRRGMLPAELGRTVPLNHFQAVALAFYLLLIVEVVSLILAMGASMGRAVAKELEILALIMLRNAFKTLGELQEPIDPNLDVIALSSIGVNCLAAVIIFVCASIYEKMQRVDCTAYGSEEEFPVYAIAKKCTALALLCLFVGDGFWHIWEMARGSESLAEQADFFARFYTLLIFADLFLLLVSEGSSHNSILLFRNSSYTAGALFMRIALGAPHFWDAGLGVFAALYIIAVSYAVKRLHQVC